MYINLLNQNDVDLYKASRLGLATKTFEQYCYCDSVFVKAICCI